MLLITILAVVAIVTVNSQLAKTTRSWFSIPKASPVLYLIGAAGWAVLYFGSTETLWSWITLTGFALYGIGMVENIHYRKSARRHAA